MIQVKEEMADKLRAPHLHGREYRIKGGVYDVTKYLKRKAP